MSAKRIKGEIIVMIKILVDSASDCRKEDGIYDLFVPITANIDGVEYADGIDLDADKFYELQKMQKNFRAHHSLHRNSLSKYSKKSRQTVMNLYICAYLHS